MVIQFIIVVMFVKIYFPVQMQYIFLSEKLKLRFLLFQNKTEAENNIAGEYRDKKDSASDSLILTDGDLVLDTSNLNGKGLKFVK